MRIFFIMIKYIIIRLILFKFFFITLKCYSRVLFIFINITIKNNFIYESLSIKIKFILFFYSLLVVNWRNKKFIFLLLLMKLLFVFILCFFIFFPIKKILAFYFLNCIFLKFIKWIKINFLKFQFVF